MRVHASWLVCLQIGSCRYLYYFFLVCLWGHAWGGDAYNPYTAQAICFIYQYQRRVMWKQTLYSNTADANNGQRCSSSQLSCHQQRAVTGTHTLTNTNDPPRTLRVKERDLPGYTTELADLITSNFPWFMFWCTIYAFVKDKNNALP